MHYHEFQIIDSHLSRRCTTTDYNAMHYNYELQIVDKYSNFRKYATPPDEKRCIITEKSFLWSLGIFLGNCLA